jgi:hypothetical protein
MRWVLAIVCLPFLIVSGALLALSFRSIMYSDVIYRQQDQIQPTNRTVKSAQLESMDREFYFRLNVWQYPARPMNAPGMQNAPAQQSFWRYFSESQSYASFWQRNRGALDFSLSYRGNPVSSLELRFPQWLPIVLTGLPPLAWIFYNRRYLRRRWRAMRGQCAECGYDLRATPERCPECGTVAGKEAVSS